MQDKPTFNPQIHHRRSIRLRGYDYAQTGLYFITICCENRECKFGKIVGASLADAQMELNEYGTVAYNEWVKLSERFSNFELDVFQIMPNHMHGIIVLNPVGAGFTPAQSVPSDQNAQTAPSVPSAQIDSQTNPDCRATSRVAPTIGDIVGAYKSLTAKTCLEIFKSKNQTMGKLWQRNYYEHIIRNEQSYQTISKYIINNPVKWKEDKFFKS